MRQLHPVSFHERFVASGSYIYAQDGVDTGDAEYWTLHEPGDGGLTLRADYDGRSGSGVNWLFEGFYLREKGRFERFDLTLFGTQRTDAKFVFTADEAQISLRVDGVAQTPFNIAIASDVIRYPPALVGAYLSLLDTADSIRLFVPELEFVAGQVHGGAVERAIVHHYSIKPKLKPSFNGSTIIPVKGIRLERANSVTEEATLDRDNILLHYVGSTGRSAHLTQYVHRPETIS